MAASVYPDLTAGLPLTADLFTASQDSFVYKQVTTSRVNNTFADDPELQYPLEAAGVYLVEFLIHAASNTAAGFRTMWNAPTGASGLKECWGADQAVTLDSAGGGVPRSGVHQLNSSIGYGDRGDNNTSQHLIEERAVVTTLGAGNLAIQWAQITTNATSAIVAIGSYMKVRRLS